jgi:hypothetical protein
MALRDHVTKAASLGKTPSDRGLEAKWRDRRRAKFFILLPIVSRL